MLGATLDDLFENYAAAAADAGTFCHSEGSIHFSTNHAESATWCRRHLRLYASAPPGAVNPHSSVEFRHIVLARGAVGDHANRLTFDGTVPLYNKRKGQVCRTPQDCVMIVSREAPEGPRLYLRRGSQIMLLSEDGDRRAMLECARIIRDVVRRQQENAGFLVLHASCAGGPRGGLLFIGPKFAGKSSSLLACLAAGLDLVGNDRVYVGPGATALEARAWVSTTNLSLGAFQEFPQLRKLLQPDYRQAYPLELRETKTRFWDGIDLSAPGSGPENSRSDKVVLTDDEVAGAFGVRHADRTELRGVIFPRLVPGDAAPGTRQVPLEDACEMIARETWSLVEESYFPDVFRLGVLTRQEMGDNLRTQVRRAHEVMPFLLVESGFSNLRAALRDVIGIVN